MHLLGRCRYRYAHNDYCGLTVVQTRYGAGHVAPPKWAHYPVLTASAPGSDGSEAEVGGAVRADSRSVGLRRSAPAGTRG